MVKELRITDKELQDVGLRPLITAVMMEHGFKEGFVRNNDDGSVSVFADADPEKLKELREALQHEIKRESENRYSKISKDFRVSEWTDPNPGLVELMPLSGNFNDMLSLRQVTKGASVIQNGFENTVGGFENTVGAINQLGEKLGEKIDKGFTELPERLAKAIKGE